MTKTAIDMHTTVYASHHENERRITVDEYGDGEVWMCIIVPGGSTSLILTYEEAQKVIEGIQKVMSV